MGEHDNIAFHTVVTLVGSGNYGVVEPIEIIKVCIMEAIKNGYPFITLTQSIDGSPITIMINSIAGFYEWDKEFIFEEKED